MTRQVTILGAGPAGLLAAAAVEECGHQVQAIYGKRSAYAGAQYLHRSIPDVTKGQPDGFLQFVKLGTREGYADKVYGDVRAKVSWDNYDSGMVEAWSMDRTYYNLWQRFRSRINEQNLDGHDIAGLQAECDLLFSSIPLPKLCLEPEEHEFKARKVLIQKRSLVDFPNTVVYSGRSFDVDPWYRTSYIFGAKFTEYAPNEAGQYYPKCNGVKPLETTCTCHPDMLRIGRFGRWERDVLTHHAYEEVFEHVAWVGAVAE